MIMKYNRKSRKRVEHKTLSPLTCIHAVILAKKENGRSSSTIGPISANVDRTVWILRNVHWCFGRVVAKKNKLFHLHAVLVNNL